MLSTHCSREQVCYGASRLPHKPITAQSYSWPRPLYRAFSVLPYLKEDQKTAVSSFKPASEPILSANQPAGLPDTVRKLLTSNEWQLTPTREGLTRTFKFPSFVAAMDFMERVAGECENMNHHPTWTNTYNRVTVVWTTHKPKGLSMKDVKMVCVCDAAYKRVIGRS